MCVGGMVVGGYVQACLDARVHTHERQRKRENEEGCEYNKS